MNPIRRLTMNKRINFDLTSNCVDRGVNGQTRTSTSKIYRGLHENRRLHPSKLQSEDLWKFRNPVSTIDYRGENGSYILCPPVAWQFQTLIRFRAVKRGYSRDKQKRIYLNLLDVRKPLVVSIRDFKLSGLWIQHWLQGGYKHGTPDHPSRSQAVQPITAQYTGYNAGYSLDTTSLVYASVSLKS